MLSFYEKCISNKIVTDFKGFLNFLLGWQLIIRDNFSGFHIAPWGKECLCYIVRIGRPLRKELITNNRSNMNNKSEDKKSDSVAENLDMKIEEKIKSDVSLEST